MGKKLPIVRKLKLRKIVAAFNVKLSAFKEVFDKLDSERSE